MQIGAGIARTTGKFAINVDIKSEIPITSIDSPIAIGRLLSPETSAGEARR